MPKFTLKQLMLAVTCLSVSFGSLEAHKNLAGDGRLAAIAPILDILAIVMPGVATGILLNDVEVAFLVVLAMMVARNVVPLLF